MRLGAVLLIAFLFAGRLIAQETNTPSIKLNWPSWRGPFSDGIAPFASPPIRWSENENLAWKTRIEGSGCGSPVIWGDRVFLLTAIPVDKIMSVPNVIPDGTPNIRPHSQTLKTWKPQQFAVICIHRESGKLLWKRVVHEAMPHQGHHHKGSFASASPVTDGKLVWASFGSYGLYCLDFDGREIWRHEPRPQAMEDGLGEGSSPALHGDWLIVVVDHELQSHVTAYDKNTGAKRWRQNRDSVSNWTTPRIVKNEDRYQVVINGAPVKGYDLETGRLLWKRDGQSLSAVPMPAAGQGMVFTASGWQKDLLQAIRVENQGTSSGQPNVSWSLNRSVPYVPSPLVWGDELYLLEDKSFISCLSPSTGKPFYMKKRLPGIQSFSASPTGADGRVYLVSENGTTVVIERGRNFEVLAVNKLDDTIYASPAMVGDSIYLRGKEHLYCFRKPKDDY